MQEDHVSMGWSAARKLRRSVDGLAGFWPSGCSRPRAVFNPRALTPAPATGAVVDALLAADASRPGTDRWLAPEIDTAYRLVVERHRPAAAILTGP